MDITSLTPTPYHPAFESDFGHTTICEDAPDHIGALETMPAIPLTDFIFDHLTGPGAIDQSGWGPPSPPPPP